MKNPVFEKNLAVLKKRIPNLAEVASYEFPPSNAYHVEQAKNGQPTLAIEEGGRTFQVHSKYDPQKEALQQVKGKKLVNPKIAIILGMGFAYHVRACLQEMGDANKFIVVIERDARVFQTAVQSVDLTDLFESKKILWIIDILPDSGLAIFQDVIKSAGLAFQLYLKALCIFEHPVLVSIHSDYYRTLVKHFRNAAQQSIVNYGNCPNDSMIGMKNILGNLATIIRNPGIKDLYGAFRGVPGILVSTGPSLDKNAHLLKGMEGKCVMACADSALWPLLKKEIRPHMFATLERIIETVATYRDIPEEEMKKIWMAATPLIVPEGYQAWKGRNIMVFRDLSHFEWLDLDKGTLKVGASCSNMGFKILEALGCDPIILVGQDLSFKTLEQTHASGSSHEVQLTKYVTPEMLFKVKGNTEEYVQTYEIFEMFRKSFVLDVAHYKGTCINSTAGGAFIEGTQVMPLEESIARYCTKPVDTLGIIEKKLKYPTKKEIEKIWKHLRRKTEDTISALQRFIDYCDQAHGKIQKFEAELTAKGFTSIEHFLKDFPTQRLDEFYQEIQVERAKIGNFGPAFNQYIMHIVQMVIVRFEMDFNELPSICEDEKRCRLQALRIFNKWFSNIRDICKIALTGLEESFAQLKKEFGGA